MVEVRAQRASKPRSALALLAGLVAGFFAGTLGSLGGPEGENGTDLFVAPGAWSAVTWVLLVSWVAALGVVWAPRFPAWTRLFALGWLLGLPVVTGIGFFYSWITFGTVGHTPVP
ncbi:hypothetical protein ACOACQ_14615 [Nocardioides sp. CPCC 206347]|uniref:hypothetical protein n=1 Tax=unclassified Nocardioides TaxID=2615069 RepID=UPI0036158F51